MEKSNYDIVIVGGGHAGAEAAWIASDFNLSVALVSGPDVPLGSTPCNPAVGGVGKGQVVREIDALGGLMGKVADRAAIQYRTLNDSKGHAVRSTRVQVDKDVYSSVVEELLYNKKNLEIIRDKVQNITRDENRFVILGENNQITAKKLIITAGTFLGGRLHVGKEQESGGRTSCSASKSLESMFFEVKSLKKRFKTGTPPRLNIKSIDFNSLEPQASDPEVDCFHFENNPRKRHLEQVSCYLTRTNSKTLSIIRENKENSPIFNGQIQGVGPRYCPSIEDKAFRYPDRDQHHVFLEPEGLNTNTVYPNGVSTSLPREIQEQFLRTIPGCEKVEILIPGYAVEYDVVDTTQMNKSLEMIHIPGLYFAGQVNGTSGYEEAAGQGLIAGINASLSVLGRKPLVLDRNESYIGVMVEDLVTNQRDEPYRLFTARSENRLYIREDNAVLRMMPYREELGLKSSIDVFHEMFHVEHSILTNLCVKKRYSVNKENLTRFKNEGYGALDKTITLSELLKRSHLDPVDVLKKELLFFGAHFNPLVVKTVAIDLKYEGYIKRSMVDIERIKRYGQKKIDWETLHNSKNISNECRQRIAQIKPETFSELKNIEGIRPATLAFVAGDLL